MLQKALCTVALALAGTVVHAQLPAPPTTYDVVSVTLSDPALDEDGVVTPLPNGIGYNAVRVTVQEMLAVMLRMTTRQITGGPDWVRSQQFDIQTRADRSYSTDELHAMFVSALEDRFKLRFHVTTEEAPAYLLQVAPTGLRIKAVDAGTDRHSPLTAVGEDHYKGDRVPMNYFCFWLGQNLQDEQRPVLDRTGLTGVYDFDLTFRPPLSSSALGEVSEDAQDLPSVFQALRDQLGLVLIPHRGPVPTLRIDHIEAPSAN